MLDKFRGQHVLLLQGPNGYFFRNVGRHLRRAGARVSKVNFNPGDAFFYRDPPTHDYRGTLGDWPAYLEALVAREQVDVIVLFGDCREYHRTALTVAERLGIPGYVFEEGYLRPDYVTLERGGVNGNSRMPKDPAFYRNLEMTERAPAIQPVGPIFFNAAWYSALYACSHNLLSWRYPHYRHHRDLNALRQAYYWVRGGVRKVAHKRRDRQLDRQLCAGTLRDYYLVPLQVHLDSQIFHSRYGCVSDFIEEVATSFRDHAPPDSWLLLKHHPFDRPYRDYSQLVESLRRSLGLGSRLVYADMINLPAALRHARGTIVINSTVGLSSIHHGTPTLCLGKAVYDMPGLTHQGPLESFWEQPEAVDLQLYRRFRWWLRANNQLNGSVWSDLIVPP